MSVTFNPITLNVVDSSGNTVGTVTIDQTVADSLYDYFVAKLQADATALQNLTNAILQNTANVEAIANAIANDDTAIDAIYTKIKEKLQNDLLVIKVFNPLVLQTSTTTTTTTTTLTTQLTNLIATLLPLQMLTALVQPPRNSFENILESVLPLIIIIPLIERLL